MADSEKRWFWIFLWGIFFAALVGCNLVPGFNPETPAPENLIIVASYTPTAGAESTSESLPASTPTPQPTYTQTPTPTPESVAIGPFVPLEYSNVQPMGEIYDLRVSPDGTLWLITSQGLSSFADDKWTIHPNHGEIILGFDTLGRAWVTTKDGEAISAWDGEDWQIYDLETGWTPAGPVWRAAPYATVSEEIITDQRGWVWLATQQDVRRFDGEQWRIYDPDDAGYYPSDEMLEQGFSYSLTDMAVDSVGDVWIADCAWMGPGPVGQGARWFTGRYWWGRSSQVVASGCVEDIEVDSAGLIWVGVDETLWRYSPRWGWKKFSPPEIAPGWGSRWGYIAEIELEAEDTVWVTLSPCGGASCDTGLFLLYRVADGVWTLVSENGPGDLALGDEGAGWLCAGNNLYSITGGTVELVADLAPFYCTVEMDAPGRAWLAIPGQSMLWLFDN